VSSIPPPTDRPSAATPVFDPAASPAGPELVLLIEEGRGRRTGARGDGDRLCLSAQGITIEYGRMLQVPLSLPLGAVKVAAVEPGPAKVEGHVGRFPVLRRLSARSVIPQTAGIEGWLWTRSGGTAMTTLGHVEDAPNLVLVFAKPLDEAKLQEVFRPAVVDALAARSALGRPSVVGLALRVIDTSSAEKGLRRWGFEALLTDKDVSPTQRRHLPTDTPVDPLVDVRGSDAVHATTSVAPPGMS
jgi:hypothetical protein